MKWRNPWLIAVSVASSLLMPLGRAAATETVGTGSKKTVGFRVLPSASWLQWNVPFAIEPMNRIDGSPYFVYQTGSSNNDIYYFNFGAPSFVAYATTPCPTTWSDCELAMNAAVPFSFHEPSNPPSSWVGYDVQATLAHELGHWAGADHDVANIENHLRFSGSATGPHWPTMSLGYASGITAPWQLRWLTTDDAQAIQVSNRTNSVGFAADQSFDNPAYPNSWFHAANLGHNFATYCNNGMAFEGPCYHEYNGQDWASTAQDFWNYGSQAPTQIFSCTTARAWNSVPTTITLAIWDLASPTPTYNSHVIAGNDSSWRQVCSPIRTGTAGRRLRIEVYVNTPNINVDLDDLQVWS
jgi:hypothetical protein